MAVVGVTPLPMDVVTAGVKPRLAGVDTVDVEGTDAEVSEELSAVLELPDDTKVPWIVREVLRVLSMWSLPASLALCTDVMGDMEAEVEDGARRIGPIGAKLARDPIFTVIPAALLTCNIKNLLMANTNTKKKIT